VTILKKVKGGWINIQHKDLFYKNEMITQERKSKYKHKITVPKASINREEEMREWCEQTYGPGGRKHRWRFGWIQDNSTFYFKSSKDAMMFTLRWSS
jgi:glucan-binding YG repeat protein